MPEPKLSQENMEYIEMLFSSQWFILMANCMAQRNLT